LTELLDTLCGADAPRCRHLIDRPVQMWILALPDRTWRCRGCAGSHVDRHRGRWLGDLEEFTCDRCRRYLPSQVLTPTILRQDMWVIVGSLCSACTTTAQAQGAKFTRNVTT